MKRPAAAVLPGLLFLRDDNRFVLALVVEGTGRRTRRRADRATDDGPDRASNDGPDDSAPDRTAKCAAGLLVAVALTLLQRLRGALRRIAGLDRFVPLNAVVRDGLTFNDTVVGHGRLLLHPRARCFGRRCAPPCRR